MYEISSHSGRVRSVTFQVTFQAGVVSFTVSIPPGNYGITNFITVLTNAMTAASLAQGTYINTYSGSYNQSTGQLTISIGVNLSNKTLKSPTYVLTR